MAREPDVALLITASGSQINLKKLMNISADILKVKH